MLFRSVIGHSLGASVGLALEKAYKKQGDNPYGIIQSKSFGAPVVSGNLKSPLLKNIVKNEIVGAGVAGMGYIGASTDSAIGFSDGGLLTGIAVDFGKKISTDFANRITEDTNTNPDRIRYFGDPISAFDFNATTVMPSFGFRWKNSAHSYKDLCIKDAIPIRDTSKIQLTPSRNDSDAEIITEQFKLKLD